MEDINVFTEKDVRRHFLKVHIQKVVGPDKVKPILRNCGHHPAKILWIIFNLSFSNSSLPLCWKTFCIVPIPKKIPVLELNDLRPVALTFPVIKVFFYNLTLANSNVLRYKTLLATEPQVKSW